MAIPITPTTLHPHQVRAGRAVADVTMQTLAAVAGVSAETILRLETGATVPSRTTAARVIHALSLYGIVLVDEADGGGSGIRMREPSGNAVVVRRDPLRNDEIGTVVRVDGRPVTARVPVDALAPAGTMAAALVAFDLHRPQIARAVARKVAADAFDLDGHLRLGAADLVTSEAAT